MAKTQRDEEMLLPKQIENIFYLYRDVGMELALIAERYDIDEMAVRDIVNQPRPEYLPEWCVKWDDDKSVSHVKCFKTFRAAKMYHSRLRAVHWSKIEKC